MTIVTQALGAAPGIQFQGTQDKSEVSKPDGLSLALFMGHFNRGRLDQAFPVTQDTIAARLGYDPTDADYMAIQDALDMGVPEVWVRRIRAGMAELVAESGDFDDYTLPTTVVTVSTAGVVALGGATPSVSITFEMFDVMDAGCSLDVAFFQRPGAETVAGLDDVQAQLTWKDSTTGQVLYRITGLLAERTGYVSLADAAADSELFQVFTVAKNALLTSAAAATDVTEGTAWNAVNTLGRNKTTLTLPVNAGAAETALAGYLNTVYADVQQMASLPDYIVLPKTDDLAVWTLALRLVAKLNVNGLAEIDGSLDLDSAIALAESLDAKDHRITLFYNVHKARYRDATGVRGAKVNRPVVGVQVGYRLLRNANSNASGIPPIHIPVAGYDYPIRFGGMEASKTVILDEPALNRLAAAKIIPVVFERYEGLSRFIFGDCLTQYDSATSALRLGNAAEITTYTENVVMQITRRWLLKNTATYIERADSDCRRFLDACVTAGLLVPADDLGGYPYTLSINPREDRPFDGVTISLARRPEGCVRAVYFNSSVNK